jgi:hypothetical protein
MGDQDWERPADNAIAHVGYMAAPLFASDRSSWQRDLDHRLRQEIGVPHLLDSIKSAANTRGVLYRSLIKVWLQAKLHSR